MADPASNIGSVLFNACRTQIAVKPVSESTLQVVGLVQNISFNEDYNVQPFQALGHWGPVGFMSLGFQGSIQIGLFVPLQYNSKPTNEPLSVHFFDKTRDEIASSGAPLVLEQIVLQDKVGSQITILDTFENCILTSQGGNVTIGQQVMRNLNLFYVKRIKNHPKGHK